MGTTQRSTRDSPGRSTAKSNKVPQADDRSADILDPLPAMFPALGSSLDKLDKALTSPFNRMYLSVFEWPLSVVGTWFGVPITSMCLCSVVLGALHSRNADLIGLSVLLGTLALGLWFYLLVNGRQEEFYGVPKTPLFLAIIGAQVTTHISNLQNPSSGNPSSVSAWYLISYLLTQLIVLFLKCVCRRMRPGAAIAPALSSVPRLFPALTFLDCKGFMVFESFPSGDAAGAMCFSAVLASVLSTPWAHALCLLACVGRMYLFAHHFLDVACGAAIAFAVTSALGGLRGAERETKLRVLYADDFALWHSIVVVAIFAVLYGAIQKTFRMKHLPKQFASKGKWWY